MPETAVFDHYEVMTRDDGSLFELGCGAMGITYKAFDTRLRIPVALKVINPRYLYGELAWQRFIHEARTASELRNRHVASVFHLGTGARNRHLASVFHVSMVGNTWFYAMELIDGETVDSMIHRQGALSPIVALGIAAQIANALHAAAQLGLVHREITPANVMLVMEDNELVAKVIGFRFGKIVVAVDDTDEIGDMVHNVVPVSRESAAFASPEHFEIKELDVRSDIYSLGVTLWYMLAGQVPFVGSMVHLIAQHLSNPPPFEKLPDLPPPVIEVLRRMLAKRRKDRYQTPIDLLRAIEFAIEKTKGGSHFD